MEIYNKVIIITGGSKGFGKSLAEVFNKEGAKVIIASHDEIELKKTAKDLNIDSFVVDVTKTEDVELLADYVANKYGGIDVWINNAGIQIAPSLIEEVNIEKIHHLYDVNFFGYFYGCQTAIRRMKKQKEGLIININSTAGLDGKATISAYSSSKWAIRGLTESIRKELSDSPIKIYSVHPGGMQTEIYKEKYPDDFKEYMSVEYATQKVIDNLKLDSPEQDLVIKRPGV
ncbi:MAG: SDR family oxidoreductase [bacterium]